MTRHAWLAISVAMGTLVTGIVAGAASAVAEQIPFTDGYVGPITIKFSSFESFTGTSPLAPGDQNFGVFDITSIQAAASRIHFGRRNHF
jgi:hypothetical protein